MDGDVVGVVESELGVVLTAVIDPLGASIGFIDPDDGCHIVVTSPTVTFGS